MSNNLKLGVEIFTARTEIEYAITKQHPNITFTSEVERDEKLPFHDIDISRSQSKFNTSVYRKPTFNGLFTNFHSFIPRTCKRCLVSCLIHRIFNLCSSCENFYTQLEVVRNRFKLNGFPSHMFERITRRFLDNTFDPKPSVNTIPKKIIYFCLPFTEIHSLQIRTQINRLCNAASLISILDSFFAPSDESVLFSLLKIKFPSTCNLVLFTFLSVDAVPRRMWVKPQAIYTLEY